MLRAKKKRVGISRSVGNFFLVIFLGGVFLLRFSQHDVFCTYNGDSEKSYSIFLDGRTNGRTHERTDERFRRGGLLGRQLGRFRRGGAHGHQLGRFRRGGAHGHQLGRFHVQIDLNFTSNSTSILRPIRSQFYVQFDLNFTSNSTSILHPIRPQFYVQFDFNFTSR